MEEPILYEKRDHVGLITLNRPKKRNAFTREMFRRFGEAFAAGDADDDVRCTVVHAAGDDFTTGLDLMDIAPAVIAGDPIIADGMVDPWGIVGVRRKKPMVTAVHGRCYTLGFELGLASETCVAAEGTIFALLEVRVGIQPAGGGVFRFAQQAGWSNAMRYALTGDDLPAAEALRLGVIQEVVPAGTQLDRALAVAETICAAAPLGVQAALRQGQTALYEGWPAAIAAIPDQMRALFETADAAEALSAMVQRRPPDFKGR